MPFNINDMLAFGESPPRPYKSYKGEQFNKKLTKARMLINSVGDTSLKPEDKAKLLAEIRGLFTN